MLRLIEIVGSGAASEKEPATTLTLTFEDRRRSRLLVRLADGREAALMLPRGSVLRDGDLLRADTGAIVVVRAAFETLSVVRTSDPHLLTRAAYHLGNRHVPLQIGLGWLAFGHDHVLDGLVRDLGLDVTTESAAFEPEAGGYRHQGSEAAPSIHGHSHEHGHGHSHELEHEHSHEHEHAQSTSTFTPMTTSADAPPERLAFLRLLQLSSPALPVGAFAYSQGLEPAVTVGLVTDEASASRWILGLLAGPVATLDLAVFARIQRAFAAGDADAAWRWNAFLLASRSTSELQAEDRHLGAALSRVLLGFGISESAPDADGTGVFPTFVAMFALATARWKIDLRSALEAYAFTWAQAQTSAAVRLVPLGQSAGVRILADAATVIPSVVDRSLAIDDDDDVGAAAPLQALLSAGHETQYSRLFRS